MSRSCSHSAEKPDLVDRTPDILWFLRQAMPSSEMSPLCGPKLQNALPSPRLSLSRRRDFCVSARRPGFLSPLLLGLAACTWGDLRPLHRSATLSVGVGQGACHGASSLPLPRPLCPCQCESFMMPWVFERLFHYSLKMKCTFERASSVPEAKLWHVCRAIETAFVLAINSLLAQNGLRSPYQSQIWSQYHRL